MAGYVTETAMLSFLRKEQAEVILNLQDTLALHAEQEERVQHGAQEKRDLRVLLERFRGHV